MNLLDGNVGIPRVKMPQLAGFPAPGSKAESLPRDPTFGGVDLGPLFFQHYVDSGVPVHYFRTNVRKLRPTQKELNLDKVRKLADLIKAGKLPEQCLFIAGDYHIVDGHHRWAGCMLASEELGTEITTLVSRINTNIHAVIREALHFAKVWGPLN